MVSFQLWEQKCSFQLREQSPRLVWAPAQGGFPTPAPHPHTGPHSHTAPPSPQSPPLLGHGHSQDRGSLPSLPGPTPPVLGHWLTKAVVGAPRPTPWQVRELDDVYSHLSPVGPPGTCALAPSVTGRRVQLRVISTAGISSAGLKLLVEMTVQDGPGASHQAPILQAGR